MNIGLTTLVSLTLILSIVADDIPKTSSLPVLGKSPEIDQFSDLRPRRPRRCCGRSNIRDHWTNLQKKADEDSQRPLRPVGSELCRIL